MKSTPYANERAPAKQGEIALAQHLETFAEWESAGHGPAQKAKSVDAEVAEKTQREAICFGGH
jgi:hypothetical protein